MSSNTRLIEDPMGDESEQFWLNLSDSWTENGLSKVEEVAKQLITVNGFFLAGYQVMLEGFLKKELIAEASVIPIFVGLTVLFAIASIWLCIGGVILTEEVAYYKEPYTIREVFLASLKRKQTFLMWAVFCFTGSAVFSLLTIGAVLSAL